MPTIRFARHGGYGLLTELEWLQTALPERYTLLRELERGGMSRVFMAREALPERDVVIKLLDEGISSRLDRDDFVREVEVTSQVQHPHVVPIYAAGDVNGRLYYVMPFIEGESLRDRLDKEGRLPIEEALTIVQQVASALQHAHSKGIAHRDIKPSNILFQGGHAVVTDFGIAGALRAPEGGSEFTQSGLPIGTPDYMSPEQASGENVTDGRTDTYALACVLFEMLAGQPPFHSRTVQATLARHLTDTMPSIRSVRSSVPLAVEQTISQALEKSPADRPDPISHFANALITANQPERLSAKNGGRKPFRSSWRMRIAVGLLVVVSVGLGLQTWSNMWSTRASQSSVAVIPFENRTGDDAFDLLGLSIAEEIITRLTTIPGVFVIDPYTAVSVMRAEIGTPDLLDSLRVERILHGYIERRGERLVVNVSESNPDGFISFRTQYEIDPDSLGRGQVQVTNAVTLSFLQDIGLENLFDPGGSVIGPGRDAYLAGNEALGQRTTEGMREAALRFREATELEPRSATALSALSSTYALSLYYKYDIGLTPFQLAARSLAAADSAIAVGPEVANGYSTRGYIRGLLRIDMEGAAEDFERAELLAPNAPNGPSWSARILAGQGRIDEAFREAERARDLDPRQAGRRTALASLGFQLGRYEVTIEESRAAYEIQNQLLLAKAFEGRALALTGRAKECLAIDFGVYDLVRALCLHADGQVDEAMRVVTDAEQQLEIEGSPNADYTAELLAQDLASYYGMTGDPTAALRWIEFAYDLSPAGVDIRILDSALFDPVRSDVRFAQVIEAAHLIARERVMNMRMALDGVL